MGDTRAPRFIGRTAASLGSDTLGRFWSQAPMLTKFSEIWGPCRSIREASHW